MIAFIRASGIYLDSRATKEIMALAEFGEKILVLGWDRDGNAKSKCEEIFAKYSNVSFLFYQKMANGGLGLSGICKIVVFMLWALRVLRSHQSDVKVIHACDLYAGIPAKRFCGRDKTPFIYDIYDYFVDAHCLPSLLRSFVERKEISIINCAKATIICTEERAKQIEKANPRKLVVVHNTPDIDINDSDEEEIQYDYVYVGALNGGRLIREILEGYDSITDVIIAIGGYGCNETIAAELAERYENFTYTGRMAYRDVLKLERKAKVLSAIYDPSLRNHQLCAPNKFYEALALAKTVIVCRGTGIDQIVEQYKIGMVIDYDVKQFYDALRYLKENSEICKQMGHNGRKLYEEKYDWAIMKKALQNIYC